MNILFLREETRAARVTVLVVAAVLLCWAPHCSILIIIATGFDNPPPWLHILSIALLNIYTVLSPLLFAFRSRRVQRDIAHLLGTSRCEAKINQFVNPSMIHPSGSRRDQGANFRKMRSYSCPQVGSETLSLDGILFKIMKIAQKPPPSWSSPPVPHSLDLLHLQLRFM